MLFTSYLFLLQIVIGAFALPGAVHSQAEAALSIQPASATADHCSLPVITVRLDNVTDLTAYTVRLAFEPQYLRVLEVSNGDFLKDEMPPPDNAIDNTAGTVRFGMARFGGDTPPESGSGALVVLRVMTLQAGQTAHLTIDPAETHLVGWPEGTAVAYQAADGIIYTGDCVAYDLFLPLVLRWTAFQGDQAGDEYHKNASYQFCILFQAWIELKYQHNTESLIFLKECESEPKGNSGSETAPGLQPPDSVCGYTAFNRHRIGLTFTLESSIKHQAISLKRSGRLISRKHG